MLKHNSGLCPECGEGNPPGFHKLTCRACGADIHPSPGAEALGKTGIWKGIGQLVIVLACIFALAFLVSLI